MDCHLNWKYHVLHVSKKIAKGIKVLNEFGHFGRAFNYVLSHIYCAIIYPFLTCGSIYWGSSLETTINSLVYNSSVIQQKSYIFL